MKYFNEYGCITPETEMALDGIIDEGRLRYILTRADDMVEVRALGAYIELTITHITNEIILRHNAMPHRARHIKTQEDRNADTN